MLAFKRNKGELYEAIQDYFDDKTQDEIRAKEDLYFSSIEKQHSQVEKRYYIISIFDIELFARTVRKNG